MEDHERRRRLGAFLKSKRACLEPSALGLPSRQRRSRPGLRREEVATLAGISVAWYARLEAAAPITVSPALLDRLASVLALTDHERAYVLTLAIKEMPIIPSIVALLEAGFTASSSPAEAARLT